MYRRFDVKTKEVTLLSRSQTKDGEKMTVIDKGKGIIRRAKPEEIIPGEERYFMKHGYAGTSFVLMAFSAAASWDSIVEMCRCDMVYVRI